MPLGRKRKKSSKTPPKGMMYSRGGHSFVPIDPNSNVTPSPSAATANSRAATPGHVHDQLIARAETDQADSPTVQPKKKAARKTVPKTVQAAAEPVKRGTAKSHQMVPIDFDIFKTTDTHDPSKAPSTETAGKSIQSRLMKKLKTLMTSVGSEDHQATLLYKYFKTEQGMQAGVSLGVLNDPNRHTTVASSMARNLNEILEFTKGKNSNDALTFRDMVFLGICPTRPKEDAEESTMKD